MTARNELIARLEFVANTSVIDEEREEVCDLAVEAIRDLERRLAESQHAQVEAGLSAKHCYRLLADHAETQAEELAALRQQLADAQKDANKWFLLLSDVVLTVPATYDPESEEIKHHARCLVDGLKAINADAAIQAHKEG